MKKKIRPPRVLDAHSWNRAPLKVGTAAVEPPVRRKKRIPGKVLRVALALASSGAGKRRQLKSSYKDFAHDLEPNLFLTFNFGYKIGHIAAQGLITKFFNIAQRRALGRNWLHFPPSQRPRAVGFLEHLYSNTHYHILANADGRVADVIVTCGNEIWSKLASRGQFDFKIIKNRTGAVDYAAKELTMRDRFESVFVYSPKARIKSGKL